MTLVQRLATIALAAVANFLTRLLPFALFKRSDKTPPRFIRALGDFLPGAIMAMLVVYCFREVNWTGPTHGLPETLAGLATVLIHLKWRQLFVSLIAGTLIYMLLLTVL